MPMIWTEPRRVVKRRNVTVYHAYKDGDAERPFEFHYTTDVTEQADPFDIRDLDSYREGEDHKTILRRAIDRGEPTAPPD